MEFIQCNIIKEKINFQVLSVEIKTNKSDQEALLDEETKLNTMNDIATKIQNVNKEKKY